MTDTMNRESATRPRSIPGSNRLFAAGVMAPFDQHVAVYGRLDTKAIGAELITAIEQSGLIGRGGAGFSVGRKFEALGHRRAGTRWRSSAVVIANGAEGEPRSLKDEQLLRDAPHLVIDGLLAAAAAVGARRAYLYATAVSIGWVKRAIRERHDAKGIIVVEAPESFISGEASAVVNAIENGIALPVDRTERMTTSGLKQQPTLVHNVETLAHVALIARYGAAWFRSVGTPGDPGTRLVTVSGAVANEGVLEVAGGTRIVDIIAAFGGARGPISAVLVGGYHGTWVTAEHLEVELSPQALAPFGAHPGAGILYVISKSQCGLQTSAEIVRYLARESAQQCGPCMFGLPEMARLLEDIASGVRDANLPRRLASVSESVVGRGSCHHPNGTSRLVLSALSAFSADVTAHLGGRCVRAPETRR